MKIKTQFYNVKKESPETLFLAILPTVVFNRDMDDKTEIGGVLVIFFLWAFGINFYRERKIKTYVVCSQPIGGILTKGKEYEVIKSVGLSYVVKRDDGSIDRVAKTRFTNPIEK